MSEATGGSNEIAGPGLQLWRGRFKGHHFPSPPSGKEFGGRSLLQPSINRGSGYLLPREPSACSGFPLSARHARRENPLQGGAHHRAPGHKTTGTARRVPMNHACTAQRHEADSPRSNRFERRHRRMNSCAAVPVPDPLEIPFLPVPQFAAPESGGKLSST